MASVRLHLTPGYEDQLLRAPELRRALSRAADHVAHEVVRAAPRQDTLPAGRRAHYADMVDGVVGTDERGRLIGRVLALHYTSLWVEFGSVNNPPHAPLRRGLDASQGQAL